MAKATANSSAESSPRLDVTPNQSSPLVDGSQRLIFSLLPPSDHIPLWKKLCYAVGSMPYAMCNTVLGFYLSIFLLEVAILDPVYVLVIVFTGRVWDALTDPAIGYLCNRTNTRLGRLRPWLLGAMVPAGIIYFFLWFVPPKFDEVHSGWKFLYYLVCYFAFQAVLTCIHVPYTSLTMHLSHSNKERDSATLYRMVFEVIGTLLGVGVYTAYFTGFVTLNADEESDCSDDKRESDLPTQRAYRYHALTLGMLVVVFITTTFLAVREQKDVERSKIGFFQGIKSTFSFRPYACLFFLELFSWLAIQFVQGNYALYIKYSLDLEDQYPFVIAVLLVATMLWMPVWQLVLIRIGKKTTFVIGMWVFMVTLLMLLFIDFAGDKVVYIVYPLSIVGGAGVAVAYLLPWSMLPDVVDEAFLVTGVRREELFYAFFVFGVKFAGGVSLGISTGIYKIAQYDETKCDQPWSVPLTLKLLVSLPPIIFVLLSLLFLHCYPITERRRERTKQQLQERRKSSARPGGFGPTSTISSNAVPAALDQGYVRKGATIRLPHQKKDTGIRRSDTGIGPSETDNLFSDSSEESSF